MSAGPLPSARRERAAAASAPAEGGATAHGAHAGAARVVRRAVPGDREDLHADPLARRVLLARGVSEPAELRFALADLPPPDTLPDIDAAVRRLLAARAAGERVLIVGDYDCDGATSTAVAVLGLRALGFRDVDYLVPNRFSDGYGLSPAIVRAAVAARSPGLIVTVDNGVASVEGVAVAREAGVDVVVTDHHLPPESLPDAVAIVDPNLAGSAFPRGNLAGVGVIFYVLLALRAALARTGDGAATANLAELLDLVAIGTVADVVPLDRLNRTLVEQGLRRIRAGRTRPGVLALLERAGRDPARLASVDIGFALGPRLNAAGRLDDMRRGIECLLSESAEEAAALAGELDALNTERRRVERQMRAEAEHRLAELPPPAYGPGGRPPAGESGTDGTLPGVGVGVGVGVRDGVATTGAGTDVATGTAPFGVCLFDAGWHQGVIGILAGRLKERLHRPVVVFTTDGERRVKGSARSIPGVHVRDVLQAIATRSPEMLEAFGGHAMAAGMTLSRERLGAFADAFDAEVRRTLDGRLPAREWLSDGPLGASLRTLESARLLGRLMPWGQGFEAPQFDGEFEVLESRTVGAGHLKMTLAGIDERGEREPAPVDAIAFGEERVFAAGTRLALVYALDVNRWRDAESLQLMVRHVEPLTGRGVEREAGGATDSG